MNFPKFVLRLIYGKRLPTLEGEITIPGLTNPITIHRDGYGVPYIRAKSEQDAFYGLGFCQGQDRGFQLEMLLRVTRGTLSEMIGERALSMDRLSRRVGFYRSAQGHVSLLEEDNHQIYQAFAQGINHGIRYGCPKLPHEFALLKAEPTPWTVADVLAGLNYIGFGLSSWTAKLTRLIILENEGPDALRALDDDYPVWNPVSNSPGKKAGKALNRLDEDLHRLMGFFGSGASNNWALTSAHTSTGRPLFANDPHLAPSLPAPWYLAHLYFPGLIVCGASFVGAPSLPSGFNEHMAWGITAGLVDNIDIYYEELGEDGATIRQGDQFIPCETLTETYQIKGKPAVTEKILITPRGPIISDALDPISTVISMRATWMTPRPVNMLTRIHHVKTFDELVQSAKELSLSSLNMVCASADETIGWVLLGEVPQRKEAWGIVPLPGWEERFDWLPEFLPFEQMPKAVNPETGFIATANNQPFEEGAGPYLGRDWLDGYRVSRIIELLQARSDWNLDMTRKMQMDQFAIPWRQIREIVLGVPADTEEARLALELLSGWDGVTAADSGPAAVYEFFIIEMIQRMAKAKAPNSAEWVMGKGHHPLMARSFFSVREVSHLVRRLQEQPEGWFENGWQTEVAAALCAAVQRLQEHFKAPPQEWSWGAVHQLVLLHPMGSRPPLDKIFNLGPFPYGGDHQTISQAGRMSTEFGSKVTGIANLRMAVDVGNWRENYFVLAGGQSGNPFSPHYDDLLQLWLRGEAVTLAWTGHTISRATEQLLELIPADG